MEHTEAIRINTLTRHTYYEAFDRLKKALPPPLTDDPEDLEQRDNRAMAELASLAPVNSAEVKLAVLFVSASAHAEMVLGTETHDLDSARKVHAQAASMMRQAFGGLSQFIRLQAVRTRREANPKATDTAAWTEHIALEHMGEARKRSLARETAAVPAGLSTGAGWSRPSQTDAAPSGPDAAPSGVDALPSGVAGDASGTGPIPSSVSPDKTESRSSYNETSMRQGRPAVGRSDPSSSGVDAPPSEVGAPPAGADAPSSWPGLTRPSQPGRCGTGSPRTALDGMAGSSPAMTVGVAGGASDTGPAPSSVSPDKTESRSSYNETSMRQGSRPAVGRSGPSSSGVDAPPSEVGAPPAGVGAPPSGADAPPAGVGAPPSWPGLTRPSQPERCGTGSPRTVLAGMAGSSPAMTVGVAGDASDTGPASSSVSHSETQSRSSYNETSMRQGRPAVGRSDPSSSGVDAPPSEVGAPPAGVGAPPSEAGAPPAGVDAPPSWPGLTRPSQPERCGTGSPCTVLDGMAGSGPAMTVGVAGDASGTGPTPSSVSRFETESRSSYNETPMRQGRLIDDPEAVVAIVSAYEHELRLAGKEAPTRYGRLIDDAEAVAAIISAYEKQWLLMHNEMPMRQAPDALAGQDE